MSEGRFPHSQILGIEVVLMGMGDEEIFDFGEGEPVIKSVGKCIGREIYQ